MKHASLQLAVAVSSYVYRHTTNTQCFCKNNIIIISIKLDPLSLSLSLSRTPEKVREYVISIHSLHFAACNPKTVPVIVLPTEANYFSE